MNRTCATIAKEDDKKRERVCGRVDKTKDPTNPLRVEHYCPKTCNNCTTKTPTPKPTDPPTNLASVEPSAASLFVPSVGPSIVPSKVYSNVPTVIVNEGNVVKSRSLIGAMAALALVLSGGFMLQCMRKRDVFDDDSIINDEGTYKHSDDEISTDKNYDDDDDVENMNSTTFSALGVPCFNWDGCNNGHQMRDVEVTE